MLDTQQQMLIEQRVANDSKSVGVAYLLWFLFAGFGAHRFYLGHVGSGVVLALITFIGLFTLVGLVALTGRVEIGVPIIGGGLFVGFSAAQFSR